MKGPFTHLQHWARRDVPFSTSVCNRGVSDSWEGGMQWNPGKMYSFTRVQDEQHQHDNTKTWKNIQQVFFPCDFSIVLLNISTRHLSRLLPAGLCPPAHVWHDSNPNRHLHFPHVLGSSPPYHRLAPRPIPCAFPTCVLFHHLSKFVQMALWVDFFLNNFHCRVSSLLLPTLTRTASCVFLVTHSK